MKIPIVKINRKIADLLVINNQDKIASKGSGYFSLVSKSAVVLPYNMIKFFTHYSYIELSEEELGDDIKIAAFEKYTLDPNNEFFLYYEIVNTTTERHSDSRLINVYLGDKTEIDKLLSSFNRKYIDHALYLPKAIEGYMKSEFNSVTGACLFIALLSENGFISLYINSKLCYSDNLDSVIINDTFFLEELIENIVIKSGVDLIEEIVILDENGVVHETPANKNVTIIRSTIEDFFLDKLTYNSECFEFNFSTRQSPPPIYKRASGQLLLSLLASVLLFCLYPATSYINQLFVYKNTLKNTVFLSAENQKTELAINEQKKNIARLEQQTKELGAIVSSLNETVSVVSKESERGDGEVELIVDLVKHIGKSALLFDYLCISKEQALVHMHSENHLDLVGYAAKLSESGMDVWLSDISKDKNSSQYHTKMTIARQKSAHLD